MQKILESIRNKKIKLKLQFLTRIMAAGMIIMAIAAIIGAVTLHEQTKTIADEWLIAIERVGDLDYLTSEYRIKQYGHIVCENEADFQQYEDDIAEVADKISVASAEYQETISSDTDRALFDEAMDAWNTYLSVTGEEFYSLSRAMELEQVNNIMLGEAKTAFDRFQVAFDELLEFNKEQAAKASSVAEITFYILVFVMIAVSAIAILIGLRVSKFVTECIVVPTEELQAVSHKLTAGDFDTTIQHKGDDELGILADNFREAFDKLSVIIRDSSRILGEMGNGNFNIHTEHEDDYVGEFQMLLQGMRTTNRTLDGAMRQISEASSQVSMGSTQLAEGASNLAEGATDQAGAIEELSATIASVTNISEESYKNADSAAGNAKGAAVNAASTREEINGLTDAMERITETSKEIENIIAAIEDIASQTNLLSLNASIEAARAGEAGRGFAVVADQIGKLANDSAQSAVSTRELITKSLTEIESGSNIVNNTVVAIDGVLNSIEEFANVAAGAAEASRIQTDMLKQIESGINQITEIVQSNSAAAEETSAISEELSAQAITLGEMVGRFKLRD